MDEVAEVLGVVGAARCAVVGDEPLAAQCVDVARAHGLDVVLLITDNPLVREFGIERGIEVFGPGELAAGLHEHPADVLLSIANRQMISDDVLARVGTAISFHDGPLPGYAGLNVTNWALLAGEPDHAVTWHLMTSDVGGGRIVATEHFPITDDETAFSLNARCYEAGLATFPRVAAALASGSVATKPQPDGVRRTFRRYDRPAVLLDPATPAAESARNVRALDVGHRLRNTVGVVRLVLGTNKNVVYVVDAAHVHAAPSGAAVGTLVDLSPDGARLATTDGDLVITALSTPSGAPVPVVEAFERHGVQTGSIAASPPVPLVAALAELEPRLARDESFWLQRLTMTEPTRLPPPGSTLAEPARTTREVELPNDTDDATVTACVGLWLARTVSASTVAFAVTDEPARETIHRLAPLVAPALLQLDVASMTTFAGLRAQACAELELLSARQPLLRDAVGREPHLRGHDLATPVVLHLGGAGADEPFASEVTGSWRFSRRGDRLHIDSLTDPADAGAVDRVAEQVVTLLRAGLERPDVPAIDLPMLGEHEVAQLDAINDTSLDHDRTATIDALFHAQVARTPDAPALSAGLRTMTYVELELASRALAARMAELGVARGDRVGIAVPRGIDMVVSVLATLDLGAAYLPLDPTYPIDRLGFMVDDAGIKVLVATDETARELRRPDVAVLDPTVASADVADQATPVPCAEPGDLAYVIYTSGSTGVPKGVMLEHREVVNFFVAMDQVIDPDPPGVWLAVTSLSFDISVLELLWTLTRGFHVVLKSDRGVPSERAMVPSAPSRPVTLSLFYFAAGEDAAADGYRLLLESARFADRNGFEAVWTPERHFHAFGGAYPNPSVTGAALAAVTTNVGIRAGSVVLPLHSPIRVTEEWAVVDNLSHGRVAISFAAGWQPNDFVLNPSAFATAKEDLPRNIDLVQRLWRGESVSMPGHDGAPVEVRTLPRPVQASLPVWLTSAGSPATFERAGTLGVNVLTHLLGQSVEQLAENIERYRTAWRDAGHDGDGRVTLMMHTYLDRDADNAREVAREPMKSYLGTAVGLLRDFASAFPVFAGSGKGADDLFKSLSPEEMDQLLEMAAQRYLGTSGLFGTPDDAAAIVDAVSAAGVDEVACLVDFGIDTDAVLSSLDLLLEAKSTVDARRAGSTGDRDVATAAVAEDLVDDAVASLVARHGVTHLQCTPSLAAMLVADPADREALRRIRHLMLGGEALPTALAADLRTLVSGRFTNMYGPTETTIWSLTQEVPITPSGPIPIGTPIANTTVFVLDPGGRRLPIGAFGELHIGGEGVARGYHNRPDLTAERFVDRAGVGRVYATGDVARIHPDGHVEFAGRADNQVKIRGHRIELGEIESVLDRHPQVVQSVVVTRDDRGDTRLVGYAVLHHGADVTSDALRRYVADALPEAMVPSVVQRLDAFPLTPNGKIDRKALPADTKVISADAQEATAPPADTAERLVAEIWTSELQRTVGREDNFFDIGGHSLLAVKVFRRLSDATSAPLALTDVFRFPTVRTFAAHLSALQGGDGAAAAPATAPPAAVTGTDRGAIRRRVLAARRGGS